MKIDIALLHAVVAVAKAGGFREAARMIGSNPSYLSDAVRRVEQQLGVRLFHRTTRTVALTEVGRALMERLMPAMSEVDAALDIVNRFRDTPSGTLRLNVPVSAARLVLPTIVPAFLKRYPDIQLDVVAESNVQDVFRDGCDAGIRYDECLEQDVIALPIGKRQQRFAVAAAPEYLDLHGRPEHPSELLQHRCIRGRYASGIVPEWEFERDGEVVRVKPNGPLMVSIGAAVDLAVATAIAGGGIIYLFEEWLRPAIERGELEAILTPWWQQFSGPYLYYPDRRLIPSPLKAFIDFIRELNG
ncbi:MULTISPECIES: LysR family transcriptional regulator [Yersinia]|jgi:DNA-binding transcriptional LysR family regulator|uniref:LysR family transcriptional regulator n=1 Tax=Yersinia intermedia TaxID=631 RepID=A0ABX6F4C9_YERIN|nr:MULTISPECIES: LysR family transcriptional regulator [Yersinia]ARB82664.1 LysR family transcriptional regulator [Yersinia sp. FDAARGOS_228]AVL36394.1 LysR family transcriptional regulator [Yersinia intermedia]EEQ18594.1 Transcriptional regulator, LysR family [Yersinia intermedia ATCC 29909]MCB5298256.1 LysR family transcriptional regulator [Yersinia intermedia]MDA5493424.1 LysR family transcriptional regulator [Yersinia intermedia]